VADVRAMPQYVDASFGGVLDKGTLDALLCGDSDVADSAAMLAEVHRLLAPGGSYLMVTSAAPRSRLRYLLPQEGEARGQGAGQAAFRWRRVLVYEVGQQGAQAGPFDAGDEAQMAALPGFSYSHFVYVCIKGGE
jgi:hypothetical protein